MDNNYFSNNKWSILLLQQKVLNFLKLKNLVSIFNVAAIFSFSFGLLSANFPLLNFFNFDYYLVNLMMYKNKFQNLLEMNGERQSLGRKLFKCRIKLGVLWSSNNIDSFCILSK